jgi:uncharacterized protein (DUF58 family)
MSGAVGGARGARSSALARWRRLPWNLVWALALASALLVLGWASGYWILLRAAYLLLALVVLAWVWSRFSLRGLEVEVERRPARLQAGQEVTIEVRVRNSSNFPKLWLEVEDITEVPGGRAKAVLMVAAHGYRVWQARIPCPRRGRYRFGPLVMTGGDPFGLFRRAKSFGGRWEVLVYPAPVPLPYFWVPAAQFPGEGPLGRPSPYLSPSAAGVREYEPGDPVSRIHWLTTARLGRLMAKTFDYHPASDVWLVLDLEEGVHAGQGEESTEEYMVTAACSMARRLLDADLRVGMVGIGREPILLPPARGPHQYERMAEALALVRADGRTPLDQVLVGHQRSFGRNSTLVVITPSPTQQWAEVLANLGRRGIQAVAVLLEADTFGGAKGPILPYGALVAGDVLVYCLRRGDDLSLALGLRGARHLPGRGAVPRRDGG